MWYSFLGVILCRAKTTQKSCKAKMTNATWKKRVLSHMLQERVTFAFDGVVAQIINSWQARRSHRLPPSFFSLHLCFLPLCRSPVWLAVCCSQGAGEGDYSCRTGPGPGRPELTTGKKGFWKIPPKQQLPSSIFHFFLFCPMLVIDWRRGEKKSR